MHGFAAGNDIKSPQEINSARNAYLWQLCCFIACIHSVFTRQHTLCQNIFWIFVFIQSGLRPFTFISGILFVSERITHVTNSLNWYGFVCRLSDCWPHVSGLRTDLRRLVSGNWHFSVSHFYRLWIVAGFIEDLPRKTFVGGRNSLSGKTDWNSEGALSGTYGTHWRINSPAPRPPSPYADCHNLSAK